jgi:DNA replication and repair protein RecF
LILQRLVLETFRNHEQTSIECSSGVNIFLGNNGEGKTNILEGISYLCLSKSFFATNDTIVMKVDRNGFTATGSFLSDGKIGYEVRVSFDKLQNQKLITVNKAKIDRASSLIGQFPVVILSPEQSSITNGSPSDRRRFVDFVVSQSSRTYLECLIEYRRILKQRNRILSDIMISHNENTDVIDPWNENLVHVGTVLIKKRIEFIEDFQSLVIDSYTRLAGKAEQPGISYVPSFELNAGSKNGIEEKFYKEIQEYHQEERHIGYSLVGPHRDEFIFQINKRNTRSFASQGQHKTFLVALKLAEFFYLKNLCNETPILLLDDVLSEMDGRRSQRLIEETSELGQVFITSTGERSLDWNKALSSHLRKFYVEQGKIDRVENAAAIH